MRFNNTTYPESPTYPGIPLLFSSFYSSVPYNHYHHSALSFPAASDSAVPLETRTAPPVGDGVIDALTQDLTTPAAGDPIDTFFTAKRTFAARSVEDILSSLYERETLKYDNLRDIDYQSATLRTRLFELQRWRLGLNPQMERVRFQVEQELAGLEGEKRKEHVECWRDVTRLKGDLRDALREFGQEQRKTDLLNTAPSPPWKSKISAGN